MSYRASLLTWELKKLDRHLYAVQTDQMLQVWRKPDDLNLLGLTDGERLNSAQFILPLTDDWTLRGKAVEWGVMPVISKLRQMDSWRDDSGLEKFAAARERHAENKKRATRNEFQAIASDIRSEVARVTNDIRMGGN